MVRLLNKDLVKQGRIKESVMVHSFEEYKAQGGKRSMLDVYSKIKEMAKSDESMFITCMDMLLSGIDVNEDATRLYANRSQALWYVLHLWFKVPLRKVSFIDFDLDEFNKL